MAENYRANRQIRVREVRLIGQDGEQLGILPTETALEMAIEADLDLVEVAPNSRPPVCRIMDYGKFKYDKKKKSKKKPHVTKVKEVRLRPKTDPHDYDFKVKRARHFLSEGHRVVATVLFRGREMAFRDRGKKLLEQLVKDLVEDARPEQAPRLEGRRFTLVLLPLKSGTGAGKDSGRHPAKKPDKPASGQVKAAAESKAEAAEPAQGGVEPGPVEAGPEKTPEPDNGSAQGQSPEEAGDGGKSPKQEEG